MNSEPYRIRLLVDDCDLDENDCERPIPAGSIGTVHPVPKDGELFDVVFDNGGWIRLSAEELARDTERIGE